VAGGSLGTESAITGIRFGCREAEAQGVTEVERGRLPVLRIIVVTAVLVAAWLAGWRSGAVGCALVLAAYLATYLATQALPQTSPLRVAAGGFGIFYLGFGTFLLVDALITWHRAGPGSATLAIALLILGLMLTPVAVLFLRTLVRATRHAGSSGDEQSSV